MTLKRSPKYHWNKPYHQQNNVRNNNFIRSADFKDLASKQKHFMATL